MNNPNNPNTDIPDAVDAIIDITLDDPYEDSFTILLKALLRVSEVGGDCVHEQLDNALYFIDALKEDIIVDFETEALDEEWAEAQRHHPSAGEIE